MDIGESVPTGARWMDPRFQHAPGFEDCNLANGIFTMVEPTCWAGIVNFYNYFLHGYEYAGLGSRGNASGVATRRWEGSVAQVSPASAAAFACANR